MAVKLFEALGEVRWAKGSGGIIYGGNEYEGAADRPVLRFGDAAGEAWR